MTLASARPIDPQSILAVMADAARAAHTVTLKHFRTDLAVDNKLASGFDPVTRADVEGEKAIRAVIGEAFPDHGIIGEELDAKLTSGEFCWIVDPIDGTRAFISGVPVWGTLIGLMQNGRAIAGLMSQPFSGEVWSAAGGAGTYAHAGTSIPLRTSGRTSLATARASTTSPDIFSAEEKAAWQAINERVLQTRYGLDCYAYCLLASGHVDLVVEAGLKDVDIAPLIPIIEAAGGVVTTWSGGRPEQGGTCVAAASPKLHAEALKVLNGMNA